MSGIRSFEQAMGILANTRSGDRNQTPGRWVLVPKGLGGAPVRTRRARLILKRRATFQRILIAAGVTFILGMLPFLRALWWAHVGLDVLLVGYVIQLRRWRMNEVQRQTVVREIPARRDDADVAIEGPLDAEDIQAAVL